MIGVAVCFSAYADKFTAGFLRVNGQTSFPLGSYELPKDPSELKAMAAAGFNLVRCASAAELDRVQAAGMKGWVSVPLEAGAESDALRKTVELVMNHPALAVWEGPDEVVWNFTAFSGLYRSGIYSRPGEWWQQTPFVVQRAELEAKKLIPKLRSGCELIRKMDRQKRLIWINEAAESDMKFIRGYVDAIDITGCDIYPIHETNHNPAAVGDFTSRFQSIGKNKPVWMVLQGFSWHEIQPPKDEHLVYPSFLESRFMAYDAIAHGASGILYWGTWMPPKSSPFREGLWALVKELHVLQPFLVAKEQANIRVVLTESKGRAAENSRGVRYIARRLGVEWLIILINEDDLFHMGVEVVGLSKLVGRNLELLYDSETVVIQDGTFVTRLRPHEVKVFATSRKWENVERTGRNLP
jgi:hypothetical protein